MWSWGGLGRCATLFGLNIHFDLHACAKIGKMRGLYVQLKIYMHVSKTNCIESTCSEYTFKHTVFLSCWGLRLLRIVVYIDMFSIYIYHGIWIFLYMFIAWFLAVFPFYILLPRKAADDAMDASHVMALPEPWDRECPLTRMLLHDGGWNGKCRFHCIDVWHAFHLGVGKSWIASGVMPLQKILPETTVDKRLDIIGRGYKAFCKKQGIDPVIRKIDVHTFGLKERNGSWNKACITSNFMLYMEEFCRDHAEQIRHDEQLRVFDSSMKIIYAFLIGYTLIPFYSI